MRRLQPGTGRFRGKIPLKCFDCGRVGHYAAKCPYKQFEKGKSYYANEDNNEMSSEDEEYSDQDLLVLMARKKKKKATQKEISQKTCAAENEEDITGIECGSCDSLSCASNGKDSERNSISLEANLKINDESNDWNQFHKRESVYKDMISRMNEHK